MIRAIQKRQSCRISNTEIAINQAHGLTGTVYLFNNPMPTPETVTTEGELA